MAARKTPIDDALSVVVLSLTNNKYFVVLVTDPHDFKSDKIMKSEWVHMFSIQNIYEIIESTSDHDEDNVTLEVMTRFGIDNVRGGTFSAKNLPKHQIHTIQDMINFRMNLGEKRSSVKKRRIASSNVETDSSSTNVSHTFLPVPASLSIPEAPQVRITLAPISIKSPPLIGLNVGLLHA